MLPKIFLLKLKNRLLGVKETIMEMKKQHPGSTSIIRHAHRTLACTEAFYHMKYLSNVMELIQLDLLISMVF